MNLLKTTLSVILAAGSFFPNLAWARFEEEVRFSGSGCNRETARATVSPDGDEISILFDDFNVNVQGHARARKDCEMLVPLKLTGRCLYARAQIDLRGFVSTTQGSFVDVLSQLRFEGKRGRSMGFWGQKRMRYANGFEDSLHLGNEAHLLRISRAPERRVYLRARTSLQAISREPASEALAQIDSLDAAEKSIRIRFHRWGCGGG